MINWGDKYSGAPKIRARSDKDKNFVEKAVECRILCKMYGKTNWRKLKGICRVKLVDGTILGAEVHWYEGHGVGKKEMKIKKYL